MSDDTPEIQWEEDIPPERPDDPGADPEVADQPMGVPADLDPEDAPLPGLPETEPPTSG